MPTLTWVGKDKVVNHHHDVPFRVLKAEQIFSAPEGSPANSTDNRIIHGDNLEALKSLLPEFEGKVKCIYIDPPYNTGNEGWVYNDNVNDPKIKNWLDKVVGKEGEDLSRHDKWLCMMYPRLKLLHRLLGDNGSIWISIDDNEYSALKILCDEIFGSGNYFGTVIWQHSIQGKNDAKTISLHHNYTLCYGKKNFQIKRIERTAEHNKAYQNSDNDPRGLWRNGDVRSPNYRENLRYTLTTPSGKSIAPPDNGWRWDKKTMGEKIEQREIIFNSFETKITRKIYLESQDGRVVESIWFGSDVGTTRDANRLLKDIFPEGVPFDTPKPVELIQRILQLSTDRDSVILDSFSGSGTTAQATLKLNAQDGGNRSFILIEMMDYAETITAERVRRVMSGYGEGSKRTEGLGGGFTYHTIGEPLFLPDDNLNEAVGAEEIRKYVTWTESIPVNEQTTPNNPHTPYLLGINPDTAWIFNYEPDRATCLDMDFLASLKFGGATAAPKPNTVIIYADRCLLSKDFMTKHGIIFKKIPRDITRF